MVTFTINIPPMLAYIYHTWILWDMEDIIFPTHFPCVFARGRRRKWCWSVCGRHWSTTPALASRRTRSAKWQGICLRKRWEIWNIMEYHGNIWENDGNSYEKISLNTHTHIYIYNIYIDIVCRVSWMFFFASFLECPSLGQSLICLLQKCGSGPKQMGLEWIEK